MQQTSPPSLARNPTPAGDTPELEIRDGVARIVLRRPSQHNRIDAADIAVLTAHVAAIVKDPEVRVVVVTGEGAKTFCSGYTLTSITEHLDHSFEQMLDALEALPVPTICALNGSVYGGATDLALCCDFRIGVTGSRLVMPAAKIGVHFYPGGMRRFVTRLGLTQAKKLFLTAMALDAPEMLRIGFLTELVEPDRLEPAVQAYVDAIRETEPNVVRSMKSHLNALADGRFDVAQASRDYAASLQSDALRERLAVLNK